MFITLGRRREARLRESDEDGSEAQNSSRKMGSSSAFTCARVAALGA